MASVTTEKITLPIPAAINTKPSRRRAAAPPLTVDRAMVRLAQDYRLEFRSDGLGWFFARVTERGGRRLTYRLGGRCFPAFLRRVFPRASDTFLRRLACRCRFQAWLTSTPFPADDRPFPRLFVPPTGAL